MGTILALFFIVGLSWGSTCKRLPDCVSEVSALTGVKYLFDKNLFQEKDQLKEAVIFHKDDADVTLSETLALFDYVKIPTRMKGVWKILPAKEMKFNPDVPIYNASLKETPSLPKNLDPVQLVYKTVKGADVEDIAKSLQTFLSRHGRVTSVKEGIIIVVDRAATVGKVIPLIRAQDVKSK